MNMPGKLILVLACLWIPATNVFPTEPVPLLEETGIPPDNIEYLISDEDDYIRPESLRILDSSKGKVFNWKPGMEILTDSDSVRIHINGERTGLLPWQGDNIRPGLYRILLEKAGYQSEEFLVLLEPDTRWTITVRLLPLYSSSDVMEQNPDDNTEDITETEKESLLPAPFGFCSFFGFPGAMFCPRFPRNKLPVFSSGLTIRTSLLTENNDNDWLVPVVFSIGTGKLPGWFFSFSGGLVFGPDREENRLEMTLSAGYRITEESGMFQAGVLARLDYDALLAESGKVVLDTTDSSLTGLAVAAPLSVSLRKAAFYCAPEIVLIPVDLDNEKNSLFSGFSLAALIRMGMEWGVNRFTISLSGAVSLHEWTDINGDSFDWFGAAEARFVLPGDLVSVGLEVSCFRNADFFGVTPGLNLTCQF